jgi:hypothetical protein
VVAYIDWWCHDSSVLSELHGDCKVRVDALRGWLREQKVMTTPGVMPTLLWRGSRDGFTVRWCNSWPTTFCIAALKSIVF